MSVLGVSAVAAELGVSDRRVRQMLADGELRGSRVGRAWVVERDALDDALDRPSVSGRPWRPAAAWALLGLIAGSDVELSPVDRVRIGRRAEAGVVDNLSRLRVRSGERRFYGHPSVLGPLLEDPGVVRSGVSALGDYGVDLVVQDVAEGYVRGSEVDVLVDQFALERGAGRWNVTLRVVDDEVWPFEADQRVASGVVVAVDLLDSADERSRRAGAELLGRQ